MAAVWGFALVGLDAVPVRVEAHARPGLPGMTVVGLPGAAVREARERIRSGTASSGLPLPTRRITINLSPVDVPKEGSGFDLPVALAVLAACGHIPVDAVKGTAAVGEVSLDGLIQPTRGMLSVAESASKLQVGLLVVPAASLLEASQVTDLPLAGVRTLAEAVLVLGDIEARERVVERGRRWIVARSQSEARPTGPLLDLADVAGHSQAKRVLEIVAAGSHHLLMVGSPGAGKTMLARRLGGILPPLERDEAVDVTRVWSIAGLRQSELGLIRDRPFRAPHHTASRAALVGGGVSLRPGEVSLAHRGVLFLDELPEFSRDALEALRQPLEEGRISISRRSGTCSVPAVCTLVAAMNPCPCGYLGHPDKPCRCPAGAIERYRSRISGPLLDRIDVLVEIPPLSVSMLLPGRPEEDSAAIRERVIAARAFRVTRLARSSPGENSGGRAATPRLLEEQSRMGKQAKGLLREALLKHGLGGRGYVRTINLSRTIADLDNQVEVNADHVAEALALRLDCRRIGFG